MNESIPLVYTEERFNEEIKGPSSDCDSWRLKERMKTVSVALVLCFNIGVDPPDIVKTQPCARLECWIDPFSMSPQKAIEVIGNKLQKQYERWQPRARYKHSLDPTVDDVKKLCVSLRRNAKEERVLFHYNGHGVPRPTANGEIWVFNKSYTQYIPLSVYDLQAWLGAPSIYVYDCSSAGIIIESFNQFADQHGKELQGIDFKNCIQMAACSMNEILPMNPDLPADLFTSCLTTPIDTALRWIPGLYNDRRTMLGELNWIFTAVTDTIAWNSFPRERVMRSYDCCPVSSPSLPPTHQHPMWQAWDYAVDMCLSQLPKLFSSETNYETSHFFADQLSAFKIWLKYGNHFSNPEQLPIVLQVLLSQVHRVTALQLLGEFLDLGEWAVNLALSVGVFPYVLKLLQSSAEELKPLLVFIWSKILAVDNSKCRTMAAFILSCIASNYQPGQDACLKGNIISVCLEQLHDPSPLLRRWLAICLGRVWMKHDDARWCGVRDVAHEKLYNLLNDPVPEEIVTALYWLILAFENSFIALYLQLHEEEKMKEQSSQFTVSEDKSGSTSSTLKRISSTSRLKQQSMNIHSTDNSSQHFFLPVLESPIKRVSSSSSLTSCGNTPMIYAYNIPFCNIYSQIWQSMHVLRDDAYPEISERVNAVIDYIKTKAVSYLQSKKDIEKDKELLNKTNEHMFSISPGRKNNLSHKYNSVKAQAASEKARLGADKLENQLFLKKNCNIPSVIQLHPFEPFIFAADRNSISVWDWEESCQLVNWQNHESRSTQISSLKLLNAHSNALVLCGSDDGNVRVWNNYLQNSDKPCLISAWSAMQELRTHVKSQKGNGLLLNWNQLSQQLIAAGDVHWIRLWDLQKELKVADFPTGANCSVTALASHEDESSIFTIGCADGSVRLFDSRLCPSNARVMTWRELQSWTVEVYLTRESPRKLLAGSINGHVIVWELRKQKSLFAWETSSAMTAMASHPHADIVACGSVNQFIITYDITGKELSLIKYYDGFMGQRIGPVGCMAFHPFRILLAAGSTDSYISVYSLSTKK